MDLALQAFVIALIVLLFPLSKQENDKGPRFNLSYIRKRKTAAQQMLGGRRTFSVRQ
jgi:hypothetical protein